MASARQHCPSFQMDILSLTDECTARLREHAAPDLRIIAIQELIAESDFPLKQIRERARTQLSRKAWIWLLEPVSVYESIKRNQCDVAFIDADTYFFSNPQPVFDKLGNAQIGLTPHYFPAGKEHQEKSVGRYNLGFAYFRRTAMQLCREWCERTIRYCPESTGAQKHLDDLRGHAEFGRQVNCGPWQLPECQGSPPTLDGEPLVLYHFHEFRRGSGRNPTTINGQLFNMTNYPIHPKTLESVYEPYIAELQNWV